LHGELPATPVQRHFQTSALLIARWTRPNPRGHPPRHQTRTSGRVEGRSVHPSTTDIVVLFRHVRFVPTAEVAARSGKRAPGHEPALSIADDMHRFEKLLFVELHAAPGATPRLSKRLARRAGYSFYWVACRILRICDWMPSIVLPTWALSPTCRTGKSVNVDKCCSATPSIGVKTQLLCSAY
jgi:hypothetical protein